MIHIRSVRRRVPRTRASLYSTATGTIAAAGLMLAALAPGALAAEAPAAAPTPGALAAPATPDGHPAVPDRLLTTAPGSVASPVPANDNFSNAQIITGYSGAATGYNVGAGSEEGEPRLPNIDDGGPYHSVWYSWTAPAAGLVTFDLCTDTILSDDSATFDSTMGAYTGSSLFSLSNVASNDDDCSSSSAITFTAVSGTKYSITVDGYDGSTGYFYLQWDLEAAFRTISIDDVTAAEGDGGDSTDFNFKITLSAASSSDVTVHWQTVDGTAASPDDFASASGTATITEGGMSTGVTVEVAGDGTFESDETFSVLLSSPEGAELGDASGTGTIENDDLGADLSVYLDKFGGKVHVGGYLSYYLQVFNEKGGDTSAATATVELPDNAALDSIIVSQGSCLPTEQTLVCSFGDIAGGSYAYAIIYLVPNRTGIYDASVTLDGSLQDPFQKNNSDSEETTVFANKAGCTMVGTLSNDAITGTAGDDVICTYGGEDTVTAGNGNDTVRAGSGDDLIDGGSGYDSLFGDAGDDTFLGGANADSMNGDGGRDTLSYKDDPASVTVNLQGGYAYDGYGFAPMGAPNDVFDSVKDVIGSDFNDVILGDAGPNKLYGSSGDDTVSGDAARDLLDGGTGVDSLNGGDNTDTCVSGESLVSCER